MLRRPLALVVAATTPDRRWRSRFLGSALAPHELPCEVSIYICHATYLKGIYDHHSSAPESSALDSVWHPDLGDAEIAQLPRGNLSDPGGTTRARRGSILAP